MFGDQFAQGHGSDKADDSDHTAQMNVKGLDANNDAHSTESIRLKTFFSPKVSANHLFRGVAPVGLERPIWDARRREIANGLPMPLLVLETESFLDRRQRSERFSSGT